MRRFARASGGKPARPFKRLSIEDALLTAIGIAIFGGFG